MQYKRFKGTDKLPQNAVHLLAEEKCGAGGWCEAYYKGDVNTTKDWIVVMDTGWYYKVGATYMTWYMDKNGELIGKCNWSKSALHRTIMALKKGEPTPFDPGYQT